MIVYETKYSGLYYRILARLSRFKTYHCQGYWWKGEWFFVIVVDFSIHK